MKRLIFVTGKWSTILSLAYLNSSGSFSKYDNTLVHISHFCDKRYLDSFKRFAKSLAEFYDIKCINYCIYKNATEDDCNDGDLSEKDDFVTEELLRQRVFGSDQFEEIIVPHLFSRKSCLLISMFPSARVFCVEEGLNSYFRHHGKHILSAGDEYFLSRLSGYVSYNFLGLRPLFDFRRHGVQTVVPDLSHVRSVIERIDGQSLKIPGNEASDRILFIGQVPGWHMSAAQLVQRYTESIASMLLAGFSVYYVKHPRDLTQIADILSETFSGQNFFVLADLDVPVEKIAQERKWSAVVSYSSSALITIPSLFDTPAFIVEDNDLQKLVPGDDDFSNARNFCAAVTPSLRSLLRELRNSGGCRSQVARSVYENFDRKPEIIPDLYSRKPQRATLDSIRQLPLEQIEALIRKRPYSSLYRLAYAIAAPSYGAALCSAWTGLVLNPTMKSAYAIFLRTLVWPSRPTLPRSKSEIDAIAAERPLSMESLLAAAAYEEKAGNWRQAIRLHAVAVVAHPLNPTTYFNLIQLGLRLVRRKICSRRDGVLFDLLLQAERRRLARRGRRIASLRKRGEGIAAMAYRPDRGATGGPGGVLFLQKSIVGPYFGDRKIDYHFRGRKVYRDIYADLISGADFAIDICRTGQYGYYIAHDLGSAYGLALSGQTYIIDWHFQGSFVTQMLNFGQKLGPKFIERIKQIERIALTRAKYVVFPSDGARDMYFLDEYRGCDVSDVNIGPALYNTILPAAERAEPTLVSRLPKFSGVTFTSIGSLTQAKGQDQVLDLFQSMLPHWNRPLRWICIGDGVMRDRVLKKASELQRSFKHFSFVHLPKIPHADVMNVLRQSDVYIMLHRISIFDFATLEAMKSGCAVVLSRVGGNIDFNREGCVLFAEEIDPANNTLWSSEALSDLKAKARAAFLHHFSPMSFRKQNEELLRLLTN